MTSPIEPAADDELQFKTAEPATTPSDGDADGTSTGAPATQACESCHRPITSEYFAIGKHVICADCCTQVEPPLTGSKFTPLFKAGAFGLGAGLVGALIWYAVRRITDMEIGLIAILVGFMVGKAVRKGSGNRGGRGYQVLAVILTYCCIAANYIPDIVQVVIREIQTDSAVDDSASTSTTAPVADNGTTKSAIRSDAASTTAPADGSTTDQPGALELAGAIVVLVALVFALAMAAPFLMGMQNIIGLLIIAFALWEAWKFNRRVLLPITGPFQLGSQPNDGVSGGAA